MATYRFSLLSKSKSATIYFRVSINRKIAPRASTGKFIDYNDWNPTTNLPKENTAANRNLKTELQELHTHINKLVNNIEDEGGESVMTGKWLKHKIDVFFKRTTEDKKSELVTDAIQHIINTGNIRVNAHKKLGLSKSRLNAYNSLKRAFEIYEVEKGRKYKVRNISELFAKNFLQHLINEKKYSQGYALKFIADLKTVCLDAESNEIPVHETLSKITATQPPTEHIIYLTPSELDQIAKSDKIKGKALNNARRWLLLGCNIGQRGGDLLSITEDNFVTRNGYDVIELKQQKTGKNVTIPVLETTKQILEDGLPYKISLQKLNNYIKDVCRLAGLDEPTEGGVFKVIEVKKGNKRKRKVYGTYPKYKLITTHVCRRSFATNLYGVLPTPLIMRITAHSTEKMFLNYIGKDSLDYAQQIADFYKLQSLKAEKEPQLKVIGKTANE